MLRAGEFAWGFVKEFVIATCFLLGFAMVAYTWLALLGVVSLDSKYEKACVEAKARGFKLEQCEKFEARQKS